MRITPYESRGPHVIETVSRIPILPRAGFPLLFISLFAWALCVAAQTAPPKEHSQPAKPEVVHFEDIAARAGVTALNVFGGDTKKDFIIETTGNGAVIFDYDNDGWPDIFVACDSTPSILYHNNANGTFSDISETAGPAITTAMSSRGVLSPAFSVTSVNVPSPLL